MTGFLTEIDEQPGVIRQTVEGLRSQIGVVDRSGWLTPGGSGCGLAVCGG